MAATTVQHRVRADGWSLRGHPTPLSTGSRSRRGAGRHAKLTVKRPPPHTYVSKHLHSHANHARKSWRSGTSIILPGWRCHTGGSRSIPTVHPCGLRSGGCGWLSPQALHEPKRQTPRERKVPQVLPMLVMLLLCRKAPGTPRSFLTPQETKP